MWTELSLAHTVPLHCSAHGPSGWQWRRHLCTAGCNVWHQRQRDSSPVIFKALDQHTLQILFAQRPHWRAAQVPAQAGSHACGLPAATWWQGAKLLKLHHLTSTS